MERELTPEKLTIPLIEKNFIKDIERILGTSIPIFNHLENSHIFGTIQLSSLRDQYVENEFVENIENQIMNDNSEEQIARDFENRITPQIEPQEEERQQISSEESVQRITHELNTEIFTQNQPHILADLRVEMLLELMRLKALMRATSIQEPEELEEIHNAIVIHNNHIVGFGLAYITLPFIPNSLFNLKKLQVLCLNNTKIGNIQSDIGKLNELRILELIENNLESIPNTFQNLTNLQKLNLSMNRLKEIPPSINSLINLNTLVLSKNLIRNILNIESLKNLEFLDLSFNIITELPDNFKELINLRELDLSENFLKSLPRWINIFQNLQILSLRLNSFEELPEEIGQLHLTSLQLQHNKISELPESFRNLTELQELDLSFNQFHDVPSSLKTLNNLFNFSIYHNPILDENMTTEESMLSFPLIQSYLEDRERFYEKWTPNDIVNKIEKCLPLDSVDRTHPDLIHHLGIFLEKIKEFPNATSQDLLKILEKRCFLKKGQYHLIL